MDSNVNGFNDILEDVISGVELEGDEYKKKLEGTFPAAAVDAFFSNAIWQSMEKEIRFRIIAILTELLSYGTTHEDDLMRKGQLKELFYFLRSKDLLKEDSNENVDDSGTL